MLSIVTSYLLQAKCCLLPGIGEFVINTKPAELDIAHKQLHPPVDDILFTEDENIQANPGLVKYVALKRNEDLETAGLVLKNYCDEWKKAISLGDVITLPTFGTLQKNAVGDIFFRKLSPEIVYKHPVRAERVIRENADHKMLVGDKETSSNQMTSYLAESEPVATKKKWWGLWAALLILVAIAFIAFHFYKNGFSTASTGSRSTIAADSFNVEQTRNLP